MSGFVAGRPPSGSPLKSMNLLVDNSPFKNAKRSVSPSNESSPSKKASPESKLESSGMVHGGSLGNGLVSSITFEMCEDDETKTSGEDRSEFSLSPYPSEESDNSLSSLPSFSSHSSLSSLSSFDCVKKTLRESPKSFRPLGFSDNDVYKVSPLIKGSPHNPFYFKNSGEITQEKQLNLALNRFFREKLNDSSVKLGTYLELTDMELKFESVKYPLHKIMLVQEEIDSRFKPLGSIENMTQLYGFYNNGLDMQGRDIKEHFQRALLYSVLTGQYDEHSGNLNQDETTKELCRYDLDLSFSGGRILKDFIEYGNVFTRFGLRSVLLFAITKDSHKLLVDECLSEDLKSDLLTLISTNLDGYFPHAISEKTIKLKQFINSNFLKIKGLLDSEESVTLLDVLKLCYPEVAITLEESRNLLDAELKEKPQDNKAVLKNWFNAVNKCFGGLDFFEDMEYLRADLDDGNLNFLGKITAHLFNEDGSVKTFLPESIADINKS
jgi:hypothetical protein